MADNPLARCDPRPIGAILRETASLSNETLQRALEVQRQSKQAGKNDPLCDVLVRINGITEEEKARCLGKQWGIPFVDLNDVEIDAETAAALPEHLLREHKILPISVDENRMMLAIVDPLNIRAVDEAHLVTGCEIVPLITTEDALVERLARLSGSHVTRDGRLVHRAARFQRPGVGADAEDIIAEDIIAEDIIAEDIIADATKDIALDSEEEPIIRLVNAIIARGLSSGASDVHVQPERDKIRVRYRVDGVLHDGPSLPATVSRAVVSRIKVISHMDIAEKRTPQDGRLSLRASGADYDLRVSTLPGIIGEKVVMRIAKQSSSLGNVSKLGFATDDRRRFEELIARPYGLILVTGPTGSGKSTTLYAALNQLNSADKNIITIEDPVEQKIPGLTQIEINKRAGLTFASVLRSVLRQDPDIAMVGEVRDRETAMLASEASLTGHLVLSTLHTNDAGGAFTRLLDMDIEPFLVTSSTIGVLAQRLVRVLCPKCCEEYEAKASVLSRLGFVAEGEDETVKLYRAAGCAQCADTGYKGRTGVFELIIATDEIKDLVLQRESSGAIRACALEQGTTTMAQDAIRKILSGATTVEEALRVVDIEMVTSDSDGVKKKRPAGKLAHPRPSPKRTRNTPAATSADTGQALKLASAAQETAKAAQDAAKEAAETAQRLVRGADAAQAAADAAGKAMGVAEQALDAAQHAEQAVRDSAQDAELVETRRTAMTASDAAQFARDIAHEAREAAQEAQETAKQAYEAAEKAEHSSTTDFDRIAEATCMAADAAMKAAESAREAAQEVIDHHAGVRPAGPRTATRTKSSKGPPRRKPAPQAKKKDGLIL